MIPKLSQKFYTQYVMENTPKTENAQMTGTNSPFADDKEPILPTLDNEDNCPTFNSANCNAAPPTPVSLALYNGDKKMTTFQSFCLMLLVALWAIAATFGAAGTYLNFKSKEQKGCEFNFKG